MTQLKRWVYLDKTKADWLDANYPKISLTSLVDKFLNHFIQTHGKTPEDYIKEAVSSMKEEFAHAEKDKAGD